MKYILPTVMFLVYCLPSLALAQEKKKNAPDHGWVLAACMDVFPHKLKDTTNLADTKNYVFRGRIISLGKDKKVRVWSIKDGKQLHEWTLPEEPRALAFAHDNRHLAIGSQDGSVYIIRVEPEKGLTKSRA